MRIATGQLKSVDTIYMRLSIIKIKSEDGTGTSTDFDKLVNMQQKMVT